MCKRDCKTFHLLTLAFIKVQDAIKNLFVHTTTLNHPWKETNYDFIADLFLVPDKNNFIHFAGIALRP